MKFTSVFATFVLLLSSNTIFAQKDKIEHTWYNQEKTAKIQIYKATDGYFWGKIVWLKEPMENGKPKVDKNNEEKSLRNTPLMGLPVLKKFKVASAETYEDGTIYDPKNGKTYSCKITHQGNKLSVRGYIGISIIGRTAEWTLAE